MKNIVSALYTWLEQTVFTAIVCMLVVITVAASSGAEMFPIATGGAVQSSSFDGSNYLIGVEDYHTTPHTIAAQMIDASGATVGSLIIPTDTDLIPRSGMAPSVAFDGTNYNYLLIWADDEHDTLDGSMGWRVYGQFISMSGTAVGPIFAISTPVTPATPGIWLDGIKVMAFGGGKYLVTYTKIIDLAPGTNCIAGRVVDPNGTIGEEFRISTGYGAASDVSFDGANFFVIWREDSQYQEIRGRFVSPAGVPGTEISVNASAAFSANSKSVAFDGTNYLVVWNDDVGAGNWDVFGQFISPAGDPVGGVITISSEPGPQEVTSVAFDGNTYLSAWTDKANDANQNGTCDTDENSCWDVYGQFISKSGALVGSKIAIATDAGNQMGGVGFANGKYLALVNSGVILGQGEINHVDASYGVFISPPEPGLCGISHTGTFSIPPDTYLCVPDADVSLTPTATGWTWSCPGQHGGDPAFCSANRTPPSGTVQINGGATYATTTAATLTLTATGTNGVAVTQMRFSNDGGATWATDWEAYATTRNITLLSNGSISVQFKDADDLPSAVVTDTIILVPTAIIQINNVATDFGSIDTALDAISLPGKTVKVRDLVFLEEVTMTSPVTIVLKGGYPVNGFGSSQPPGTYTTIAGSMKIRSGTLKVDRVKIM